MIKGHSPPIEYSEEEWYQVPDVELAGQKQNTGRLGKKEKSARPKGVQGARVGYSLKRGGTQNI